MQSGFTFVQQHHFMDLQYLKFQLKFKKVIAITLAWQIIAILNILYMFGYITSITSTELPYSLSQSLLYSFIAASLGGFVFGGAEVFYLRNLLRKKPLGIVLLSKSIIYLSMLFVFYFISISLYFKNEYEVSIFNKSVPLQSWEYISQSYILLELAFWGVVMIGTFIYLEISDKLGPGGLAGFLWGRYHKPRKETRIFMFLDIKDSTFIAEKLGHKRYFNFLNDFFSDITDSVIFTRGEIYQYVGDEVVVSWTLKNGLKNARCLHCFFDIKATMKKNQEQYIQRYDVVPQFKAGFHHGEIMAGEMGVVKRDLVFSGDVLNTGARIQEQCNHYGVDNLISKGLLKFLEMPQGVDCRKVDASLLRGKKARIDLYTVFAVDRS